MCESMNPGVTNAPARSTVSAAPAFARISAVEPTATIRSPAIAIASAAGLEGSAVHTRPFTRASVITGSPVLEAVDEGTGADCRHAADSRRPAAMMIDVDRMSVQSTRVCAASDVGKEKAHECRPLYEGHADRHRRVPALDVRHGRRSRAAGAASAGPGA